MRMVKSYDAFMHGKTVPFVGLLEDFFRQRATRSLADTQESNLEMAIELLWFEGVQCVPQMYLVVDSTKATGAGRGGFVDIFVGNSECLYATANPVLVMELKNVTLRSLWKAQQRRSEAEPQSNNDYEPIVRALRHATEDDLLAMKHTFYDKEKRKWFTLRVLDTLQAASAQLDNYMRIISMGRGTWTCNGILDDRVVCRDGGCDIFWEYVIIWVGGTRVLCRPTTKKAT
jgi:hypothetical protein